MQKWGLESPQNSVKITEICPNLSCMPTPTFENVLLRKRNAKVGVGGSWCVLPKDRKGLTFTELNQSLHAKSGVAERWEKSPENSPFCNSTDTQTHISALFSQRNPLHSQPHFLHLVYIYKTQKVGFTKKHVLQHIFALFSQRNPLHSQPHFLHLVYIYKTQKVGFTKKHVLQHIFALFSQRNPLHSQPHFLDARAVGQLGQFHTVT